MPRLQIRVPVHDIEIRFEQIYRCVFMHKNTGGIDRIEVGAHRMVMIL